VGVVGPESNIVSDMHLGAAVVCGRRKMNAGQ
jgi:hypothetical protein